MLHTQVKGNRLSVSGEEKNKFFIIYGHGGHLGDVTWTICATFSFPIL